jgi:hypothetical protein
VATRACWPLVYSSLSHLTPHFNPHLLSALLIFDGLGWIGAVCVLVPYALVSIGRLAGTAVAFRAPNIVGGLLLMADAWYHRNYPSVAVNAIWIAIAVYATKRPGS